MKCTRATTDRGQARIACRHVQECKGLNTTCFLQAVSSHMNTIYNCTDNLLNIIEVYGGVLCLQQRPETPQHVCSLENEKQVTIATETDVKLF